ncbi:MAG: LON peptidase substrate-binding domain-containing protein [Hyphomicrobiaceae bacterium]|nr:LON peptidase substrate-binding domain-containing protein [Hyphomicrobiaceae bacterium]MCC0024352.1 LON peptidase substrate-binding domain-containing protein [Hyphomicrobiaceae bacterium]
MTRKPKSIENVPHSVPLFPLSGALLFPRLQSPLQIFEPRYLQLVDDVLAGDRLIGMIQPEATDKESPEGRDAPLRRVGTLGYLVHFEEIGDDRYLIGLEGVSRFDLGDEIACDTPYRQAGISVSRFHSDFDKVSPTRGVDRQRFIEVMRSYIDFLDMEIDWDEVEQTDTADLVNLGCMLSPYGPSEKQLLLETVSLSERAETLLALVEMEMAQAQSGTILQ